MTHDGRLRDVVWGSALGATVILLVVSATGAQASRGAAEVGTVEVLQPPGTPFTPVPMNAEPSRSSLLDTGTLRFLSPTEEVAVAARARLEIDRVTIYDGSWKETSSYPMGDVPSNRGACTDVVVRSLREVGIDLQELVHDDVARDLQAYGVSGADPHIDHRRLSTMQTYFTRNALSLTTELRDKSAWRAGDIVFFAWQWFRGAPPEHVGIISDKIGPRGLPLVIENGGPKAAEVDSLGRGKIVGHFRALKKR